MTTGSRKRRVLIVEDEMLVAMLVEDILDELGLEVAGICGHLDEALKLAAGEAVDFVLLDVNLDGKRSFPVADILRARNIPFAFATGYGGKVLEDQYAGVPTLNKPFMFGDLKQVLEKAGVI
ncbi:MAG: response regulator [Alphaproteobacteria bacterium]|nr:response regulator [Alphaproteobacteria bacterium]MCW5740298.1 response regulator [Alphaproteobacteria bacterium]